MFRFACNGGLGVSHNNEEDRIAHLDAVIAAYARDIEKAVAESVKAGIGEHSPEAAIATLRFQRDELRTAIETVCEGWTLPDGARKVLEAALHAWPNA